ncbi:hypothetical protein CEE39_08675 [bacterium (candidate division B38) B3_B38]|nr:MAG: hypothetical protein CEE39_08675 [bacterium (candidate division B38) B3_B38]
MRGSRNFVLLFIILFFFIFGLTGNQEEVSKTLVITNARLIDGTGAQPLDNAVIVITNGKFTAIGPQGKIVIPKEARVIDVKGKTVVPGLIDAHVHSTYASEEVVSSKASSREEIKQKQLTVINDAISAFRQVHFLHRHLMGGITTVRDVAARRNVSIMAKKAFREGLFLGSRPIVVGQGITCTGGHGASKQESAVEADGPAEFRKAVREQLKAGADLIKVLPPYSREEIKAAVEETHAHERFITVHSGAFKKQYDFVHWAVEAGADCIEHAYAIPDDVIQMMADKKMYCVPTLTILLKLGDEYSQKPGWEWKVKKYRQSVEIFRKMKSAGIKMGTGTDAILQYMAQYPGMYFDEVENFVKYGYTPMEAIVAATKISAEICDASDRLGTIEKGKLADLLVIDGDPLGDIKTLRNVQLIIQEGEVIKR